MSKVQSGRSKSVKAVRTPKKTVPKSTTTNKKAAGSKTAKTPAVVLPPAIGQLKRPKPKASRLRLGLLCGLAIALLIIAAFLLKHKQPKPVPASHNSVMPATVEPSQNALHKATVTILEGQAQASSDNVVWTDLATANHLKDGQFIRTSENSRLAIALNDGSIVRANSNSLLRLVTLSPTEIRINSLHGQVYSRVNTKTERNFIVMVDDQSYSTTEAALLTNQHSGMSGVDTFFGSLKTRAGEVTEGHRFYKTHPDSQLVGKIATLVPEQLATDTFIKWNLEQDKSLAGLHDKLGVLGRLNFAPATPTSVGNLPNTPVAPAPAITAPSGSSPSQPTPAQPTPAPQNPPTPEHPQPSGSISLTHTEGNTFNWSIDGRAPYGFKLVWSAAPDYNDPAGSATFGAGSTSASVSVTGDYRVYVCAVDSDGYCVIRSNNIDLVLQ